MFERYILDLCLSFVFLSQIEPDSHVRYPVMEHDWTENERRKRIKGIVQTVHLYVQTFPQSSYFMSYKALIS